ncbi:MAG: hypothetical protein ACE5LU_05940, partial [Anaerolineae bacterium]
TFAEALYKIGVRRFADLAQYTPDQLSRALREQSGVKVPPERIEANNWIGQARELAQQANTEARLLEDVEEEVADKMSVEEVETAKDPEAVSSPPKWRQYAGFSLFFDCVTDGHEEQVWQTRVYHDETGEEMVFSGVDTAAWVNWILEQAELRATVEPTPAETEVQTEPASTTEAEVAVPPAPVTPYDAWIEVLDVEVSDIEPWPGFPAKRLVVETRFRVSGPQAETLTVDCIPVRIEVHTVDLEGGASHLVACEQDQLQPQVFEYTSQQEFPMPDLGRHELHSIVILLPPGGTMAYHRGPIIKVVP